MQYTLKEDFLATLVKRAGVLGYPMVLYFLSIRTYLYMTMRDIQYNCEGYMALALAQYEDLF